MVLLKEFRGWWRRVGGDLSELRVLEESGGVGAGWREGGRELWKVINRGDINLVWGVSGSGAGGSSVVLIVVVMLVWIWRKGDGSRSGIIYRGGTIINSKDLRTTRLYQVIYSAVGGCMDGGDECGVDKRWSFIYNVRRCVWSSSYSGCGVVSRVPSVRKYNNVNKVYTVKRASLYLNVWKAFSGWRDAVCRDLWTREEDNYVPQEVCR